MATETPIAAVAVPGGLRETIRFAFGWPVRRRTLRIALIVGTIFTAIDQAGAIIGGRATVTTWFRVGANYLVPLCVSTLGYVTAVRESGRS